MVEFRFSLEKSIIINYQLNLLLNLASLTCIVKRFYIIRIFNNNKVSVDNVGTDETVKVWSPQKRGCYFENERYLRYFRIYTKNNCERECDTNNTYDMCGCAQLSQPSESPAEVPYVVLMTTWLFL